MTEIVSATLSQTSALSVSKTREISFERSAAALSVGTTLARGGGDSDAAQNLLDIVDISEEAQQRLLKQREDAFKLAEIVQGLASGSPFKPPAIDNGFIQVNVNAVAATERFSFTEMYELSFLQESTLSVETEDGGSFEITQSRVVEVSLAATFEAERSFAAGSINVNAGSFNA